MLHYCTMKEIGEAGHLDVVTLSRCACLRINGPAAFVRCEQNWSWSPPALGDHDLWVVLAGRGVMTLDEVAHPLAPGMAFVLPPGARPRGQQDPDHRLTVFYCHFDILDQRGRPVAPRYMRWPSLPVAIHDLPAFRESAHRVELASASYSPVAVRRGELALWQILLQLAGESEHNPRIDSRIERVRLALREDPGARWPIQDMANLAGLSRNQFTRLFALQVGLSPIRYLVQVRIERARLLLMESDRSLKEIAEVLGYRDVHFFNRQFKQVAGRTPGRLRRGGI